MDNLNQKPIRLTLKDGKQLKCKKCNGAYFMPVSSYFTFSKILTGASQDSIQEVPVALCGACGTPLEELLPKEMREEKPKIDLSNISIDTK
jgi:hypothetical protein